MVGAFCSIYVILDPLHEQEIFLLQLYGNFVSVKEGFFKCLDFTHSQNYASDVTS